MLSCRAGLLAVALLALSACGFQPLYGERGQAEQTGQAGQAVAPTRLAVSVALIPNREGQVMRTALQRRFGGGAAAKYRLDVALQKRSTVTAIDRAGDSTRRRLVMTASWRLTPLTPPVAPSSSSALRPIEGRVRAVEAYNILASDYANYAAENAALERAAARLADLVAEAATARAASAEWR